MVDLEGMLGLAIKVLEACLKFFGGFFATVVAAFAGAAAAFAFNTRRDTRKEGSSNLAAGRRALLALGSQRSYILDICDQLLDPLEHDKLRWLKLSVMPEFQRPLEVDIDSLGFFLGKNTNVLYRLYHAASSYHRFAGWFQLRNSMAVQFGTAAGTILEEGNLKLDELVAKVGKTLVQRLEGATDDLYRLSRESLDWNLQIEGELRDALKAEFPGESLPLMNRDRARDKVAAAASAATSEVGD